MDQRTFQSYAQAAKSLQEESSGAFRSEFWAGYGRGLRHAYHGEKFHEPHEAVFLSDCDGIDPVRRAHGLGYRSGAQGMPLDRAMKFADVVDRITTPLTVTEAAERSGVSRQAIHQRIKAGRLRAEDRGVLLIDPVSLWEWQAEKPGPRKKS